MASEEVVEMKGNGSGAMQFKLLHALPLCECGRNVANIREDDLCANWYSTHSPVAPEVSTLGQVDSM